MNTIGNRQKTIVHVAAAQLKLTRQVYEDILRIHGGVESSVDLKWPGYQKVMEHFKSLGFVKHHSASRLTPHASCQEAAGRPGFASPREKRMIQGLWAEISYTPRDKQDGSLRRFMSRLVGCSDLQFLSDIGAQKVIVALKAMKGQAKGTRRETRGKDALPKI